MPSTLGVQFLPRMSNREAGFNYVVNHLKPGLVVVFEDLDLARRFATVPSGTFKVPYVVHRRYNENDSRWHLIGTTPEQWVNAHAADGQHGVIVQAFNEPSGFEKMRELSDYVAELMHYAHNAKIRLVVPNFAVGHPDTDAIARGDFDSMILAFKTYPEHFLGLHEYAQQAPKHETYHIRRYRFLTDRFKLLRVPVPQILITETGRDYGGGSGDGWRVIFNNNQSRYVQFLTDIGSIYTPDKVFAAIFGYGPGYGWESFNIEDANEVLEALPRMGQVTISAPVPPGSQITPKPANAGQPIPSRIRTTSSINVRSRPSVYAPVIRQLRNRDSVSYFAGGTVKADGYTWFFVEFGAGESGWQALVYQYPYEQWITPALIPRKFRNPANYPHVIPNGGRFDAARNYSFSPTKKQLHEGLDFAGTSAKPRPVVASADGVVERVSSDPYYGKYVRIYHGDGYRHYYAHLESTAVSVDDVVKEGAVIGFEGATGNVTGPHLHWTVQIIGYGKVGYVVDEVVDPEPLLKPSVEPIPTDPFTEEQIAWLDQRYVRRTTT